MKSNELREMYFKFFESHNHKLIPSSSLIPENDPTVLFTTAGMHPLVPFLQGEKHPAGNRLVDVQKCIRTSDIDEVGDNFHLTFFEMLGNWSLGDYFKEEAIAMSYEFLTSKKYLGFDKDKLYFTVFKGDEEIPKDNISYNAWINQGVAEDHLFFMGRDENFWILGSGVGPCGPDTEMFYDTGKEKCSKDCNPSCNCGKYVEIWNDVFMEFFCDESKKLTKLKQQNVDTGMGLERALCIYNNLDSVYDTDLFINLKQKISELTNIKYSDNIKSYRIIMDHLRSSVFVLGDNQAVVPSNTGQGYVLRRLIRRTIRHLKKLNIDSKLIGDIAQIIINDYQEFYKELKNNQEFIISELLKEEEKFSKTILSGQKLYEKVKKHLEGKVISGADAFKLFDTFGFPLEYTMEQALEDGLEVDIDGFKEKFKEHQEKSKTLDAGSYKGGLADRSEETIQYHTLAHILLACLQKMFGPNVIQKGSNITSERLRYDFNLDHKLSLEEKEELTKMVNDIIKQDLDVHYEEMSFEQAKKDGAHGTFEDKYGDLVKVYSVGNVSKEICGGPHVKNTSELGEFKIIKEESSSAGIRRIKAVLIK